MKENRILYNKIKNSNEYKEVRKRVIWRDGHNCQICGYKPLNKIQTHHIKKVIDKPSLAYDINNIICICTKCHYLVDKNKVLNDITGKLMPSSEFVERRLKNNLETRRKITGFKKIEFNYNTWDNKSIKLITSYILEYLSRFENINLQEFRLIAKRSKVFLVSNNNIIEFCQNLLMFFEQNEISIKINGIKSNNFNSQQTLKRNFKIYVKDILKLGNLKRLNLPKIEFNYNTWDNKSIKLITSYILEYLSRFETINLKEFRLIVQKNKLNLTSNYELIEFCQNLLMFFEQNEISIKINGIKTNNYNSSKRLNTEFKIFVKDKLKLDNVKRLNLPKIENFDLTTWTQEDITLIVSYVKNHLSHYDAIKLKTFRDILNSNDVIIYNNAEIIEFSQVIQQQLIKSNIFITGIASNNKSSCKNLNCYFKIKKRN